MTKSQIELSDHHIYVARGNMLTQIQNEIASLQSLPSSAKGAVKSRQRQSTRDAERREDSARDNLTAWMMNKTMTKAIQLANNTETEVPDRRFGWCKPVKTNNLRSDTRNTLKTERE